MRLATAWIITLLFPLLSFGQLWKQSSGFREIPFYKTPGSISIHVNNFMFAPRKVATPPVNIVAQATAIKNFTLGPMFTYFQFKRSEFEAINATRWVNPEIRYHEFMVGLKAEYHINSVIEKIINKKIPQHIVDTYTAGWAGYSFVMVNGANSDEREISNNEKFRGGLALGARSHVLKWMGFSLEGGYSSYGYCSFGLFFVAR